MIATIIITVITLISLLSFVIFKYKKIDKSKFDLATDPLILFSITGYVFCFLGFLLFITDIYLFYYTDTDGLWLIYCFALILSITGLLTLANNYFKFIAIIKDEIILHKLFKMKVIKLDDIKSIADVSYAFVFLDNDNNELFTLRPISPKSKPFLYFINERKNKEIINLSSIIDALNIENEKDTLNDETNKYSPLLEELGKKYRENYPKKRKKTLYLLLIIFLIVSLIITSYVAISKNKLSILISFASCLIVFSIIITIILKKMDKQLKHSNLWLGLNYKFDNKLVKGSNKQFFTNVSALCIMGIAFCIPICFLSLYLIPIKVNKEDLIEVSGAIEYWRPQNDKNYIAVGIKGVDIEYRQSLTSDGFNNFIDDVKENEIISLLVKQSNNIDFEMSDVEKHQWNNFYELKIGEKEYYTYDLYIKEFNDIKHWYISISIFESVIVLSLISIIIVTYKKYDKKKENEVIDI